MPRSLIGEVGNNKLVLGQPKLGRYLQLLCGPRSNTDDFLLF